MKDFDEIILQAKRRYGNDRGNVETDDNAEKICSVIYCYLGFFLLGTE